MSAGEEAARHRGGRGGSTARPTRAPARLRRADRIRSGRDFRRLSRSARRRRSAHFVLLVGPGHDAARTRVGLTVSRKVGNAVARNRVKRRVREWFRTRWDVFPVGRDVVVIARPGAARLESAEIRRELEGLAS